jgi:hypothetical protein
MTSKSREDAVKTNGAMTGPFRDFHLDVAQRRLADALDREDALDAIRDIVTNLLGSEEIALFSVEQDQAVLNLFWSFGIDAAEHSTLVAGANPLLRRVIDGEPYVEDADLVRDGDLINSFKAFVPIRLGGRTVAVLGIRTLLPQKARFNESDVQLLRFLSREAGKALFSDSDTVQHL